MTKRPRGRPPGEKLTPFAARLPPDLHRKLKALAKKRDQPMNELIILAVRQWCGRQKFSAALIGKK